jgi:hypothetical protein
MSEHLIDNTCDSDTFCEQLARVDRFGANCRLIFTTREVIQPQYSVIVTNSLFRPTTW